MLLFRPAWGLRQPLQAVQAAVPALRRRGWTTAATLSLGGSAAANCARVLDQGLPEHLQGLFQLLWGLLHCPLISHQTENWLKDVLNIFSLLFSPLFRASSCLFPPVQSSRVVVSNWERPLTHHFPVQQKLTSRTMFIKMNKNTWRTEKGTGFSWSIFIFSTLITTAFVPATYHPPRQPWTHLGGTVAQAVATVQFYNSDWEVRYFLPDKNKCTSGLIHSKEHKIHSLECF